MEINGGHYFQSNLCSYWRKELNTTFHFLNTGRDINWGYPLYLLESKSIENKKLKARTTQIYGISKNSCISSRDLRNTGKIKAAAFLLAQAVQCRIHCDSHRTFSCSGQKLAVVTLRAKPFQGIILLTAFLKIFSLEMMWNKTSAKGPYPGGQALSNSDKRPSFRCESKFVSQNQHSHFKISITSSLLKMVRKSSCQHQVLHLITMFLITDYHITELFTPCLHIIFNTSQNEFSAGMKSERWK